MEGAQKMDRMEIIGNVAICDEDTKQLYLLNNSESQIISRQNMGDSKVSCTNTEQKSSTKVYYTQQMVEDDGVSIDRYKDQLWEFVSFQPFQSYMDMDSLSKYCMELDSQEGNAIFLEAIVKPYMVSYFTISCQVENQLENSCGHTTLVAALNSLKIDPGSARWYGKWRWHSLETLACCKIEEDKMNLTMEQFSNLAICNDASARIVTVTESLTPEKFRCWVKFCTARKDVVMVVNYDRKCLNQDGLGHYTPIAGYHEERDMVLITDVAKHKYPPYWVHLGRLLKAMNSTDNITGQNRGFILLTQTDYDPSTRIFGLSLFFRADEKAGTVDKSLVSFVTKWKTWLDSKLRGDIDELLFVKESVRTLITAIPTDIASFVMMDLTLLAFRHEQHGQHSIVARCKQPHDPRTCINQAFIRDLHSISFFKNIRNLIVELPANEKKKMLGLVSVPFSNIGDAVEWNKTKFHKVMEVQQMSGQCLMDKKSKDCFHWNGVSMSNGNRDHKSTLCPGYIELLPEHIIMVIILSWPYLSRDEAIIPDDVSLEGLFGENTSFNKGFYDLRHTYEHGFKRVDQTEAYQSNVASTGSNTVSEHLDEIIRSKLEHKGMSRLNHEVGSLNKKLRAILNYHLLL